MTIGRLSLTRLLYGLALLTGWALPSWGQTIDQAILGALESNPSIDRAEAQRRAAREGVIQARSGYLPEVSLNASASTSRRDARLRGSPDFSETSEPSSATLRIEQSLYTNGLRPIAQRQAVVASRGSSFELAATRNAVALQAVGATVQVHQARILRDTELRLKDLISSQLIAEQERFRLNAGTITDVVQAEARLAGAEASLARAEAELLQAERQFELLTDLPVSAHLPDPALPSVPFSLDEALRLAGENAPEIAISRSNYESSRLGVAAASRRYGPQVGLALEASTSSRPSPAIERDDDLRATISLSIPLFNGGRGSSEKREATARKQASAADLRQAYQDLELQITAAWLSFSTAQRQIAALDIRLDAARKALDGVIQGRNAGLWTVTDILDAMEQEIAAEQAIAEAKAAQLAAAYELSITCGLYELPF